MGFENTVLDYISGATGHSLLLWSAYRNWNYANHIIRNNKEKQKYVPKLASGEWFGACAPLNQVQDQMPIQENKSCFV
jgi:alkylation response protein AidB-like acyl-CoA dehydrogenase